MSAKQAKYLHDSYIDYRRIFSIIVVVVAAFLVISSGLELVASNRPGKMVDVTAYLKDAKKLTFKNEGHSNITVEYYQFNNDNEYLSNNVAVTPEFTKSDDGTEVTITFTKEFYRAYEAYGAAVLIHGPSVEAVDVSGPLDLMYSGEDSLSVINKGSRFAIRAVDRYDNFKIVSDVGATSRIDGAKIKNLEVDLRGGIVTASEVETLKVKFPTGCKARNVSVARHVLTVESVLAGSIFYNDTEKPAQSLTNECGRMVIGA